MKMRKQIFSKQFSTLIKHLKLKRLDTICYTLSEYRVQAF